MSGFSTFGPPQGSSSALVIGATPIIGGTSGRVLFNLNGQAAEDADFTFVTDTLTVAKFVSGAGTAAAPSIAFTGLTNYGFYCDASNVNISRNGALSAAFGAGGVVHFNGDSAQLKMGSDAQTVLRRDAAHAFALANGSNAYDLRIYGAEFVAGTNYSRLSIKHATTTLASVSGATVTATNLIPAKANVLGVNTVVTVALGTTGGTTGYTVGDGSDADRWGSVTGTAQYTDTDGNDATADPTGWFTAANNVVITAAGGNFDGTGSIYVDVMYTLTEAA